MDFNLRVVFDEKPLKTPGLRRFSLVFSGDGTQELIIKGFLLPSDNKEIRPPTVILQGKPYSIVQLSPSLQQGLLDEFYRQEQFPQRKGGVINKLKSQGFSSTLLGRSKVGGFDE